MAQQELREEQTAAPLPERLPLVLEILPGQAAEGLVTIFEAGDYETADLRELCNQALNRRNLSIEEQLVLEDINRQLQGGKFLYRGRELPASPHAAGTLEETEAGERYLYVAIRAIKPQEGG
jgi:hypothetical protein